jgi:type IV pilus assembly protein PilM
VSDIFGLAIGHDALRVAALRQTLFGVRIESINETVLERSPWLKTGMRDKELLASLIRKQLQSAKPEKITSPQAVCSIPPSVAIAKTLTVARLSDQAFETTLQEKVSELLPLPVDQTYLDWHRLNTTTKSQKEQQVGVTAVPKATIDDLLEILQKANLEAASIETESFAITRSLQPLLPSRELSLIVDVETTMTTIVLANKHSVHLSVSVPIGGQKIAKQATAASELIERIKKALAEHGPAEKHAIKELLLSGLAAQDVAFAENLAKRLDLSYRIGHPAIQLPGNKKIDPRFTTVLGLALWSDKDIEK